MTLPVRFRFDEFVLSPRQRLLLRSGQPIPLIPKYFDLLVLLVERRQDAVSKQAIFSEIWSDVIVSDGALTQAVRTLRRALGDNPREPRFIRTVSRHGYQFVHAGIIEESDAAPVRSAEIATPAEPDSMSALIERLIESAGKSETFEDARDAAERLHALGTEQAVALIGKGPDQAPALAVLRDARWDVPGAGEVPLDVSASVALIRLRIAGARRIVMRRAAQAAVSGAAAGSVAGIAGGIALWLAPFSTASLRASVALGVIGILAGGFGAGGIGSGLAAAEALARSRRGLALVICGALAGCVTGAVAGVMLQALLEGLLGLQNLPGNGLLEGAVIGGAAGAGYAVATHQPPGGGFAAPAGSRRMAVGAIVAFFTAAGAAALALSGGLLVGGIINEIARLSPEANLALAPLGRLIGEPEFGPVTRVLLSAFEGAAFGLGLALGLTSRPRALP